MQGNALKEGAVAPLFSPILRHCSSQYERILIEQYTLDKGNKNLFLDGAVVDSFNLIYGVWEAKDNDDNLEKEVLKKFQDGYPKDNILFQAPKRAILYQNGQQIADEDLSHPEKLVGILQLFFAWEPPQFEEWHRAVAEFSGKVKDIGEGILNLIENERKSKNKQFITAFENFVTICQENINPNISIQAVEEMLIQHLLTERLFRKVFDRADFANLNIIAHEIEKVVLALVTPHGGRGMFFKPLDRFYHAIESTAAVIQDFSEKQAFLNTVYEKFFQGFSVKVADKYGIVYTPQSVVRFMVNSIEKILQTEFGRSLSDKGVHILDPFVGTGNFIIHVMQKIRKTALPHKYENELHCNEVMLLPYYIASMNIEHEYMRLTGEYKPFEGICMVDTFQLAEPAKQTLFTFMTEENTERVKQQQETPLFVILGNPPYNVRQLNENDNNKNRKYPTIDQRVRETYAQDSTATNKIALSDVYIKAFRWASDRIGDEGVIAFITNSGFVNGIAFDGMRKHLAQDFDSIYILDLGGNVRQNPKLSGTTHNVFGIQVGVSIALLVKKNRPDRSSLETCQIWYACLDEFWRKEQKYDWLNKETHYANVHWQEITPNQKHIWLTGGMSVDFETFMPMGTKEAKYSKKKKVETIFKLYSNGVKTNRDFWVYNYSISELSKNVQQTIGVYNEQVSKWSHIYGNKVNVDDFVLYDNSKISWSSTLKAHLKAGNFANFSKENIRESLYRPFTKLFIYCDNILVDRLGQFLHIFPNSQSQTENCIICVSGIGHDIFRCQLSNCIVELKYSNSANGSTQCFPFYTYDEDGSNRRENLTDWALAQFLNQYQDDSITKWDIFCYVYAVLHHPQYREKYAANLKRELPRIPFAPEFREIADVGKRLIDLHINYEQQPKYPLTFIETEGEQLDWRVEKMKLSKDKTQIIYNHFLTLAGIPLEAFEYKLGNKSALHWIIDQYQFKTDKRSGIVNDPNRTDEPDYIVSLIQRVVTISLETVKIIKSFSELDIE